MAKNSTAESLGKAGLQHWFLRIFVLFFCFAGRSESATMALASLLLAMYLSLNWLSDYLKIKKPVKPSELQELITTSIAEVEKVQEIGREGVIVGKVTKLLKHPQADRLKLADVSIGKTSYRVVCGGKNLREDMFVVFAQVGSTVRWHGEGDPIVLQEVVIRGEKSTGMICASSEVDLPLPCGEEDITDLTGRVTEKDLGKNVYRVLGLSDVLFEIDNKSLTNRPDLLGHYGFARDIFTVLKHQTKIPVSLLSYPQKKVKYGNKKLSIAVQTKNCRRFTGVQISGVTVAPSPDWLQERLRKVGIRPINNVVDITNYIMYDMGQPMHAYDVAKLAGGKLIIRQAKEGEKVLALDGRTYALNKNDTVVADADKVVDIAAIMGSEDSGISSTTTEIILEAASWDPVAIRRSSQRLGLRSEASGRFEKNLDPEYTPLALTRAVELLLSFSPKAKISSALFDKKEVIIKPVTVKLHSERLIRKTGLQVSTAEMKNILMDLGCKVSAVSQKGMTVKIPSWRATKDLKIEDDLIEEIARVVGYKQIPATAAIGPVLVVTQPEKRFERKLKNILAVRLGFFEVLNYPFSNEAERIRFGKQTVVPVMPANPISSEYTELKTTLVPNLLQQAKNNIHRFREFGLFELGRVYAEEGEKVREEKKVGAILILPQAAVKSNSEEVFFSLKTKLETAFDMLHLPPRTYQATEGLPYCQAGQAAMIKIGNDVLGIVGVLRSDWRQEWDLEQSEVALCELDYTLLKQYASTEEIYRPIPKFPLVVRDFSFIVDSSVPAEKITAAIQSASEYIYGVDLFDVYTADTLGKGKKSLAYQVSYAHPAKTLTEQEIEQITRAITNQVTHAGGQLRT